MRQLRTLVASRAAFTSDAAYMDKVRHAKARVCLVCNLTTASEPHLKTPIVVVLQMMDWCTSIATVQRECRETGLTADTLVSTLATLQTLVKDMDDTFTGAQVLSC